MSATRKVSIPAIIKDLASKGVPCRLTQDKDGNAILDVLTSPSTAPPSVATGDEWSRRIREISTRAVRSRNS